MNDFEFMIDFVYFRHEQMKSADWRLHPSFLTPTQYLRRSRVGHQQPASTTGPSSMEVS